MNIQKYILCLSYTLKIFIIEYIFEILITDQGTLLSSRYLKKKSNFKKVNKLLNVHDRSRIINYVF